jgi:hypothetical protein
MTIDLKKVDGITNTDAYHRKIILDLISGRHAIPGGSLLVRALAQGKFEEAELLWDAGHGHTPGGKPLHPGHTLNVIRGNLGGFELNTSLTIETLKPAQIKKVLRIAALFHNAGVEEGDRDEIERSAENAGRALSEAKDIWNVAAEEIGLIRHLILSNNIYGLYLRRSSKMSFQKFQQKLSVAYQNLQKESALITISEAGFRKLMFALWMASVSTSSVVNRETAHLYRPLYQELDTLNYEKLGHLYQLKESIHKGSERVPNFSEVVPGVYRGGMPTEEGLVMLIDLGVKTLISFHRDEILSQAEKLGFEVISIPLDAGKPESFTEEAILDFLKAVLNQEKHPCLMHCVYGADRTGFMSAVYRYAVEGITQQAAIRELTRFKSLESEKLQPGLIERFKELDVEKLRAQLNR